MGVLLRSLLILTLTIIAFQDFKERKVWFFLLPLFAFLGSYLFFTQSEFSFYSISIGINFGIIAIVLLLVYLYASVILKKIFFREAIGIGDVLFFVGFAFSFPTISFLNFFVFSILFTLIFHKIAQAVITNWHPNAPLAGCMSLFLIIIYLVYWVGGYDKLYYL